MGNTFLTHTSNRCNGSIVIDCDKAVKMIAPSFSINSNGIGSLMMDIEVIPGGQLIPSFRCKKCSEVIDLSDLGDTVSCICQICGRLHPVKNINVHSEIVTICTGCISEIKDFCTTGNLKNGRVKEFVELYALTKSMRTIPLTTVLSKPIII